MTMKDELGGRLFDVDSGHCDKKCPYLKPWDHPFFYSSAFCWHQMRDLSWYDYWLADCIHREPDEQLAQMRTSGRTDPPNL